MISKYNDFMTVGANAIQAGRLLAQVYPTYSTRRRIALMIHMIFGCVLRRVNSNRDAVEAWIRKGRSEIRESVFAVLLHKLVESQRVYIFEYRQDLSPVCFQKLSRGEPSNSRVANEAKALRLLAEERLGFKVPRLLSYSVDGEECSLCVEGIPSDFVVHPKALGLPSWIFDELSGICHAKGELRLSRTDLPWFISAAGLIKSRRMEQIIRTILPERKFIFGSAHCDLGSENVYSKSQSPDEERQYVIVDWEYFTLQAPELTDRVSYWLGQRHKRLKAHFLKPAMDGILSQLLLEFSTIGHDEEEVAMALLYLIHIGQDLALMVCEGKNDSL